ncbi:unnamed protein product, partial [Rotaria magnacalcarata]
METCCSICLKTTSNKKQRILTVTIDAEAKIQFGYYSLHHRDLNRSLFNTKVHAKCYHKYHDRWFNTSIRGTKVPQVSNTFEDKSMLVNDENSMPDKYSLLDDCNIEDDEYEDRDDNNDDDADHHETSKLLSSNEPSSNQSISHKKTSVLIDISNIDQSPRNIINRQSSEQLCFEENLPVNNTNDENNRMHSVVSNHEFISSEQLSMNFNSDAIQTNDEQDITISSGLIEEVSFLNTPRIGRCVDSQASRARSQLRSTYQTSTPNVNYQTREIKARHRRRSEEGIPHATGANDRALIYDTPLHELHAWLTSNLKDSGLVPLAEAQNFYNQIMKNYNRDEHSFDYTTIRGDILRKQLESQFPDYYHFETVNKRNGTYIALNNISHYSRAAISFSKSSTLDLSDRQQPTTIISESFDDDQSEKCKIIFDAVRLLRDNMKDTLHLLETLFKEPNKMTELTSDLFADCVPLVIRNFIGLLTSSNRHFKNLENEYNYYDIFKKDLFQTNRKFLKNIAIGYDILNAKHDHIVSPKHILLANEICKHGRSNELLSIMNRFGHAASYKTITRVHRKVANQQIAKSSVPVDVLPDCYLVQVADNFDLNRETLHGERSYHFLNRILVQTYENNFKRPMVQLVDNHNQLSSTTLSIDGPTTTNFDASDEVSSVNFQQSIDQSASTHREDEPSINKIRAADEALRDHSMTFYHDFEPFIDNTLNPHLFAYGCIKAYYNRLGKNNLPLYSGFMATYLPHAIRPRHKVTFMAPINQDPNKSETAKECMVQMKKMLIDSGLQNNAVLVVDERIFRLCMEVKDEEWLNFQNIFLYPGDFHMMKCGMIVIWGMLEESGIDILIGELYKGATHRAVLSVAHFNKSLRTIKLIFTALHILLHNEFVQSLPTTLIDQFEQCMNKMPSNVTNVDDNQQWYAYVLDFLSNAKLKNVFDHWIDESCEKNLKFRFWTFVLLDLITPLIKLYTALRTSNFSARNAAVCDLAELFFSTNHRQYARLTARHLSDLRVCSQQRFDYLSKSFAVSRSNRNFSTIALDQTIEVTINKMGTQVEEYGPVPTGKHRKSTERGSSIPAGKFSNFFP